MKRSLSPARSGPKDYVLRRLEVIYQESKGRRGALTQVGVNQLRGIAERIYAGFRVRPATMRPANGVGMHQA